jgi:hypothetical protein
MRSAAEPTALVCVYYPQQILPGLAAVVRYRELHHIPSDAPILMLVWCPAGVAAQVRQRREVVMQRLVAAVPGAQLQFIGGDDAGRLQSGLTMRGRAVRLAQRLAGVRIGQIYFAHDLTSDFIAQAAMQAWPEAARICFGDAWGVVYTNRHFEAHTFPCRPSMLLRPRDLLRNCLTRARRRLLRTPQRRVLDAQYAMLILPSDPGGDFLPGKELVRVGPRVVQSVLAQLAQAFAAEALLLQGAAAVLLIGSYAESRLCSEDQEIALYLDAVRQHVGAGTRIVLKPHPAGEPAKVDRIAEALSQAGYVTERVPPLLDEVPVELIAHRWAPAAILSFSYSSVSLAYLGYPAVIHAMTEAFVYKHFPRRCAGWMQESNALYLAEMEAARAAREQEAA